MKRLEIDFENNCEECHDRLVSEFPEWEGQTQLVTTDSKAKKMIFPCTHGAPKFAPTVVLEVCR
jgi:hypothetical protein